MNYLGEGYKFELGVGHVGASLSDFLSNRLNFDDRDRPFLSLSQNFKSIMKHIFCNYIPIINE